MTIQSGNQVMLISGGPMMTVAEWVESPMEGGPGWLCFWAIQGAIRRSVLPANVLKLAPPPDPVS